MSARSTRRSLVDTYEASHRNESSNTLDSSAPYSRHKFLKLLSYDQLDALYDEYCALLAAQIDALKKTNSPVASLAEDFLVEIKKTVRTSFSIDDITLLNLLSETNQLIKTPYFSQDNSINPMFSERADQYRKRMETMQSSAKFKTLAGVGNALLSGLIIGVIVGLAVWTFGIAGITAARTIAIATISSVTMFGFAGFHGVNAGGLFSDAYRLKQLASKMAPLAALGHAPENESRSSHSNPNLTL